MKDASGATVFTEDHLSRSSSWEADPTPAIWTPSSEGSYTIEFNSTEVGNTTEVLEVVTNTPPEALINGWQFGSETPLPPASPTPTRPVLPEEPWPFVAGLQYRLLDESNDLNDDPISRTWSVGNISIVGKNPILQFTDLGPGEIFLRVNDGSMNASDSVAIHVYPDDPSHVVRVADDWRNVEETFYEGRPIEVCYLPTSKDLLKVSEIDHCRSRLSLFGIPDLEVELIGPLGEIVDSDSFTPVWWDYVELTPESAGIHTVRFSASDIEDYEFEIEIAPDPAPVVERFEMRALEGKAAVVGSVVGFGINIVDAPEHIDAQLTSDSFDLRFQLRPDPSEGRTWLCVGNGCSGDAVARAVFDTPGTHIVNLTLNDGKNPPTTESITVDVANLTITPQITTDPEEPGEVRPFRLEFLEARDTTSSLWNAGLLITNDEGTVCEIPWREPAVDGFGTRGTDGPCRKSWDYELDLPAGEYHVTPLAPYLSAEGFDLTVHPNRAPQIGEIRWRVWSETDEGLQAYKWVKAPFARVNETIGVRAWTEDPDGEHARVTIDFGDGQTANGYLYTHVYSDPGVYTLTVSATDGTFTTSDTISIEVREEGAGREAGIHLHPGWNLLGWSSQTPTTASALLAAVPGADTVSRWDATNQTYESYALGFPDDRDFIIQNGNGVFLFTSMPGMFYPEE